MSIAILQSSGVALGTCVTVEAVAMSVVFSDPDDTAPLPNDGGVLARSAFYVSARGLAVTAPRTGIQVVADPGQLSIAVNPGEGVLVTGEYNEHLGVSEIRLTASCGSVAITGPLAMPVPATVTVSSVGQTGGSPGCPESGAPWVDGTGAEDYEGVLVKMTNATVTNGGEFGSLEVTDGTGKLLVSPTFPAVVLNANVGDVVGPAGLVGFGHLSSCRRKLRPRTSLEASFVTPPATWCGNAPKANHLLIAEVRLAVTSAEFVEIYNPTLATVGLGDYYLWSSTAAASGSAPAVSYFNWPATQAAGTGGSDFVLRFPSSASIAPGEYQVVAVGSAAGYCSVHGCSMPGSAPNYEIPPPVGCAASDDLTVPNMLGNWDPALSNACNTGALGGFGYLGNTTGGEDLILFQWSAGQAVVKDVDYLVWGTFVHTSKTGVSGYLPDTPVAGQATLTGIPSNNMSFQRVCMNEGTQVRSGGNGITGGDETSENLNLTFVIANPTPKAPSGGAVP
jgi:hypothetical protein